MLKDHLVSSTLTSLALPTMPSVSMFPGSAITGERAFDLLCIMHKRGPPPCQQPTPLKCGLLLHCPHHCFREIFGPLELNVMVGNFLSLTIGRIAYCKMYVLGMLARHDQDICLLPFPHEIILHFRLFLLFSCCSSRCTWPRSSARHLPLIPTSSSSSSRSSCDKCLRHQAFSMWATSSSQ